VHCLYEIATRPEYVDPLREEIEKNLRGQGGWTKEGLEAMRKLDSFVKECQRYNPLDSGIPPPPASVVFILLKANVSMFTQLQARSPDARQKTLYSAMASKCLEVISSSRQMHQCCSTINTTATRTNLTVSASMSWGSGPAGQGIINLSRRARGIYSLGMVGILGECCVQG
jgi:hypothetical protein